MTVKEALDAGEKAIQAQKVQISIRDQELSQAQVILNANAAEISALKAEKDSWLNSKWLWIGVGAGSAAFLLKH